MSLSVLSVAYSLAPVGPDAAGGAEQVLSLVERGLVERGHRSLVVACEGSTSAGELFATPRFDGVLDEAARREATRQVRSALAEVLRARRVDLVHMHGLDFLESLPDSPVPVLVTLHLPPSFYPPGVFALARRATRLVCVSRAQFRSCPRSDLVAGVVPNGVDVERLAATGLAPEPSNGYALALGRICPEKGFHLALEAARRAGIECRLAGRVFRYPAHERYFEDEIAPRLDEARLYLGAVGFERKRALLAGARCLLAPSLVDETSSLVAMEALACGAPVVAFDRGALAEIVEHGRTGFLVDGVAGMAAAIEATDAIDRDVCRQAAVDRFSAGAMLDRYLAVYATLLEQGRPAGMDKGDAREIQASPRHVPRA